VQLVNVRSRIPPVGPPVIAAYARSMKFALRSLRRRPIFTATAVLTIALAIGANTALFSVIYAVLIRPLPFRNPNRLVQIWETHPALPQLQVTVPDFRDWQSQTTSFDQIAAHTLSSMNTVTLLGQGEPDIVHAAMASSNLFPAMGIQPLLGSSYTDEEEQRKERVALITENLWRRKFGADRGAIGRQIRLGAESFRIVGIVPQLQAFPEWADLWIPLSLIEPELGNRRKYHPLEVVARLKPGVTPDQAQSEIQNIARQLAQAFPDTNGTVGAYVIPLAREMTRAVRPALLLAWGAVVLVLLIACANLANLFMARMLERRSEMNLREALGAGPRQLIWQAMSESLLVAGIGGSAGVALGVWASQFVWYLAPNQIPRNASTAFEAPVWLFALAISVLSGFLFGLPVCWQVTRTRTRLSGSMVRVRSRLSSILIAGEVAMALLVLIGAALLTRTFAGLLQVDPGFQDARVLNIPNLPLRNDWNKSADFLKTQLMPILRGLPGVEDVAGVNSAPMSLAQTEHSRFATRFGIEGKTFDTGSYPVAQTRWITPEYFRVLGIPLKRGRWLTEADRDESRILINETLARRFFPEQDAIGKRLVLGVMDSKQTFDQIVGVVGDVRDMGLDQEVEPTFYDLATGPGMTLLVKTAANPAQFAPSVRAAIHRVDPEIPVLKLQPLEQNVSGSLARRRFALTLLGIFAGIAAFLTAAGIYGLLSYSVNARQREFGIRMAVGASSRELVGMILREAAVLTMPGFVIGFFLLLGFAKVIGSFVYRLSPLDPLSVMSAAVFLVIVTLFAAWLPARRAAAVDPAATLRTE
jgi:putative ABC transport system permease protein